jgi:hypothetical protein
MGVGHAPAWNPTGAVFKPEPTRDLRFTIDDLGFTIRTTRAADAAITNHQLQIINDCGHPAGGRRETGSGLTPTSFQ